MPAPKTVDELLNLIRKSEVAEAVKLNAAMGRLGESVPGPTELAEVLVRERVLTRFQAEHLLQGRWKRFTVGKYKVLERLGAGGMGQVFLCEHKVMRRQVAVKVLPATRAADPASLARFRREAQAVAALDHPNLVRAFDIDQDENLHFLVMEYVDGTNLQDLVANRLKKMGTGLGVTEACHYIYGAAHGLEHARQKGLVHRDVKPGNILVDRAGHIKVLDLGLARFFNDKADQLTQKFDEATLGTADYIAPEQVTDSHGADIRADLYALGGTFYYLLTGRTPFHGATVAQKLIWHQSKEPQPITELRPDVPAGVMAVIAKLMAKNPTDRYATPAELIDALESWVREPLTPPTADEFPRHLTTEPFTPGRSSAPALRTGTRAASSAAPTRTASATKPMPATLAAPSSDAGTFWATVAAETRPVTAEDTGRTIKAKPLPQPDESTSTKRKLRPWHAAAGAGVLVLLVGLTVWAARPGPLNPTTGVAPAAGSGPARIYVTKNATPDGGTTYPTLAAALAQAKPKDTIVLLDPVWEEGPIRLVGRGKTSFHDVTIEAGTSTKNVMWTVTGTRAAGEAVLELVETPNVTIRGLTVLAGGTVPVGIQITGACPGLEIDRVSIHEPAKTGVLFSNASGDPDNPIVLSRVRVVAGPGSETGVTFQAQNPLATKAVRLSWCRLEGPGKQAVLIDGPVAAVEIVNTRLFKWDSGLTLGKGLYPELPLQFTLQSNTFFDMKNGGIRVDGDLPLRVKADVTLKRNYFAQSSEVVSFLNSKLQNLPGLNLADNARDKGMTEGKIRLKTIEVPQGEIVSTDPSSDMFLRYRRDSKLAAVGPNLVPVGVPPD